MSQLGEKLHGNFNCSRWVVKSLQRNELRPAAGTKLTLLDVGALDLCYRKQKWVDCTAIDLEGDAAGVQKMDLLDLDKGLSYDVVCLCLVLNFSGDPCVRGDVLRKGISHVKPDGHLVVVLPSACVLNSRYFSEGMLLELLKLLGCEVVDAHQSPKLAFYLLKVSDAEAHKNPKLSYPKRLVRQGPKRNNYCITLLPE